MNLKNYPAGIILSLIIGIILILVSPEDIVLGSVSKLIYLHGALINSGLFLFIGLGLVSLISAVRKNPKNLTLLFSIEKTAIIFWVAAAISGNIASQIAWGGVFWEEPRLQATIIISLLSLGIYFISSASENPKVSSFLGIALSLSVWIFMIGAGRIMHPDNPFGASPLFMFFFAAITFVFLVTSILTVRWIARKNSSVKELEIMAR